MLARGGISRIRAVWMVSPLICPEFYAPIPLEKSSRLLFSTCSNACTRSAQNISLTTVETLPETTSSLGLNSVAERCVRYCPIQIRERDVGVFRMPLGPQTLRKR